MSAGRWFRMYDAVLDDPKVQKLPGELFKAWVNLMCIASRNGGTLTPVVDLAFSLRKSEKQVYEILVQLRNAGLVDDVVDPDGVVSTAPHNWGERQFQSDTSTDRVKRFRERSKPVSETPNETPPDTESEQKQSRTETKKARSADADVLDEAVRVYNSKAKELSWPIAQRLSETRKAKLRARIADLGGLEGWRSAMEQAGSSPFLRGETGRSEGHENWTVTLDFFLQESKILKLTEGGYGGRSNGHAHDKRSAHDKFLAGGAAFIAKLEERERQSEGNRDDVGDAGPKLLPPGLRSGTG